MTAASDRFDRSLAEPDPQSFCYDVDAFRAMDEHEQRLGRADLVARATGGDRRAIETLAEVGDADTAAALLPLLEQADLRPSVVRARVRLLDDASTSRAAGEQLVANVEAVLTALALARTLHPAAMPFLSAALDNPWHVVRAHVFDAIVRRLGVEPLVRGRWSPLRIARLELSNELPTVRAVGANRLRDWAAQLGAGASAASLGLDADPPADPDSDAFGRSFAPDLPIDVAAARRLDGWRRIWARAFLAAALERRDVRAPAALADLGDPGVAVWLDDALRLGAADDPFTRAARTSRKRLS